MIITEAEGNDVVRMVDNGKVSDSYEYGENGSFSSENQLINTTNADGSSAATAVVGTETEKLESFYRFAAESDVEFSKLDVSKSGVDVSVVSTTHDATSEGLNAPLIQRLSSAGFTGSKLSHSHPASGGGYSEPSGYYAETPGNSLSLMPVPNSNTGDAAHARRVSELPGFGNIKYEVYSPSRRTNTTYNGVTRAKTRKIN